LSTLDKPNANDRKLLADAQRTAADLAATASSRIKLTAIIRPMFISAGFPSSE
jgi:hypothetical protein